MNKKIRLFHLLVIAALFLGACNLPGNSQGEELSLTVTAAAQTLEALLSATPSVATNTNTPIPVPATITPIPLPVNTNTPAATATSNCNVAQFIADVTIPDGTVMTPGQAFVKKWRIKNIGSCAWNGFSLVFDSGDTMSGPASKPIATVNPGQEVELDVSLIAPAAPVNSVRSYWGITTSGGVRVPIVNGYQGKSFYLDIKVQNVAGPTPTNTSAPAAFAVTSVTFSNVGGCNGFTTNANITVNGAGTVNYHWIRSDGATGPVPAPLIFASAGTQSVNNSWTTTASGPHSFDIYIDTPNHQQFGSASFNCP